MKTSTLKFFRLSFLLLSALSSTGLYSQAKSNPVHVTPEAMNVLWVGIDNPIKIEVDTSAGEIKTVSGINIQHVSGNAYVSNPTEPGVQVIMVTITQKDGTTSAKTFEFRCRRVPNPYCYFSQNRYGTLPLKYVIATDRIEIKNPDFMFQIPYQVMHFTLQYIPKKGRRTEETTDSEMLTEGMKKTLQKAKPGDILIFNDVKVKMTDGTTRSTTTVLTVVEDKK